MDFVEMFQEWSLTHDPALGAKLAEMKTQHTQDYWDSYQANSQPDQQRDEGMVNNGVPVVPEFTVANYRSFVLRLLTKAKSGTASIMADGKIAITRAARPITEPGSPAEVEII